MRILVTGGAGFIGSCFVRRTLERRDDQVVVLDALTYAGNLENLDGLAVDEQQRLRFMRGSICDAAAVSRAIENCDAVVNFAAETHVDRSIDDPAVFLATNIEGTRVLLDQAARKGVRYLQVSTDEVYGSLGKGGRFREDSPLRPSSPYAASKAAADLLVGAYAATFGADVVISRCGNNYGPRQFPEKLIPLFLSNAINDEPLPLYGDGENVRDWIHVCDHCDALRLILEEGDAGQVYNVSAGCEMTNRKLVERLLDLVQKPWSLVKFVDDRPGHDRRYALDSSRLREQLGWSPSIGFEDGLAETVAWYRDNREWWKRVKSGEYVTYYRKLYGERLGGVAAPSRNKGRQGG